MCLLKTHNEPRIAENDIEVWKVLTRKGLSPYQGYPYHPGMNKPSGAKIIPVPVEQQHIYDGYLHAYTSREKAEGYTILHSYQKLVNFVSGTVVWADEEKYVVQRMLIPKGSVYYEGADDDICAEQLYWPEEETNQIKNKEAEVD